MKCNKSNQYSNENGIRIFHGISSIMMTMIWSIIMVLHLKGDPHIQMVEGFIAPLSTAKYCSKNNYIQPSNVFMAINEDNDSNSENKDNEKRNKSYNSKHYVLGIPLFCFDSTPFILIFFIFIPFFNPIQQYKIIIIIQQ